MGNRNDCDVKELFHAAPPEDVIEAEYRAPFLAHACMEPLNATAQWKDGRLDIWAPTQVPTLVQSLAASEFGIRAQDVNLHVTFLGGGFGRRLETDYASSCAIITICQRDVWPKTPGRVPTLRS